jgi:hypothetical protein
MSRPSNTEDGNEAEVRQPSDRESDRDDGRANEASADGEGYENERSGAV